MWTDFEKISGDILNVLAAIFIILAALTAMFASIGTTRFPDMLSRIHAATKPQVLGVLFMLLAIACAIREWRILPLLLLLWIFQITTIPVGAHMLARAGYRGREVDPESLYADEFEDVIEEERKAAYAHAGSDNYDSEDGEMEPEVSDASHIFDKGRREKSVEAEK